MSARSRRINWRSLLLEAFFVVLGVVLALAANEWRRSQNDRQNAAVALASIRDELLVNRDAVLSSTQYHQRLVDTLSTLARQASGSNPAAGEGMPDPRLFSGGFTRPASLLHTAWDAASATDVIRHMHYADVLLLARIYEEQQEYRRQADQVGQLIYAQLFDRGFQGVVRNYGNLNTLIATFWYRECQLLHRYDEVIPQLWRDVPAELPPMPARCRELPRR
jgi:hypothetical protein